MKKYKLLKDYNYSLNNKIKIYKRGTIIEANSIYNDGYCVEGVPYIPKLIVEDNPEWFEEVKEEKTDEEEMRDWYDKFIRTSKKNAAKLSTEELSDILCPFSLLDIIYKLSAKEKEIIDAYRNAKEAGADNIKKILITPHGIIAIDNAFELDPNTKSKPIKLNLGQLGTIKSYLDAGQYDGLNDYLYNIYEKENV